MNSESPGDASVGTGASGAISLGGSIVAVAGDWHGDGVWANARLRSLGEHGIELVIHVGDFGIWPGATGKRYLRSVDATCRAQGISLLVVPGNHEDWGRLDTLWANPKRRSPDGTPRPIYLTDHIAVLPRGWRWEISGRTFVALGGAPSLDRARRREGRDWWPQEQITPDDVASTVAGGYADVMVTHDAPGPPWCTPQVASILATNPMGWPDTALAYASIGRERVTDAFLGVKPRLVVHGHYHCSGETTVRLPGTDHVTTIWSLHAQGHGGNVRLLDLHTLKAPEKS